MKSLPLAVTAGLALGVCAGTPAASGQVTYYDLYKTAAFTQSGAAPPTTPAYYYFSAPLYTVNPGDITGGTLTDPNNAVFGLSEVASTSSGTEWQYQDAITYVDQASLDTAHPDGVYLYQVSTGDSVALTLNGDYYAAAIPYFTGSTYGELQSANPNASYMLTWNPVSLSSGANVDDVFLDLYDNTAGTFVSGIGGDLGNSAVAYDLPADTLQLGHNYSLSLFFSERQENTPNNNSGLFAGATSIAAYDEVTSLTFTAVPEPAAPKLLAAGGGLFWLLRWNRRRWGARGRA